MNQRDYEKLEAYRLVALIRNESKLTDAESRFLTKKMELPKFDLSQLPATLMNKLREATKRLGIEYKGMRLK